MPKSSLIQDRAAGSIMGAFIDDALGLGPHWYYDLTELRRDYGDWIDGYTDPRPGRYHDGLKAGHAINFALSWWPLLCCCARCSEMQSTGRHQMQKTCRMLEGNANW
jgi:hypothetical protein